MIMKILFALVTLLLPSAAFALKVGQEAPDFTLPSSAQKTVKLSDYKGKTVVLEWLNYGCPFVQKHYKSQNMPTLQKEAAAKGVVWLSIISSAPGKQGHVNAKKAEEDKKAHGSVATAVLLDENGKVGKAYGAETTPHIFVINPERKLAYQGAIDDKPSTEVDDVATKLFAKDAIEATLAGKPVAVAQTKAYGCSVKYQ